jgi:hypothetical protein
MKACITARRRAILLQLLGAVTLCPRYPSPAPPAAAGSSSAWGPQQALLAAADEAPPAASHSGRKRRIVAARMRCGIAHAALERVSSSRKSASQCKRWRKQRGAPCWAWIVYVTRILRDVLWACLIACGGEERSPRTPGKRDAAVAQLVRAARKQLPLWVVRIEVGKGTC